MKNDTEQLFSLATLGFFAFSLVHNLANQFTQLLYYLDEAQEYLPHNTHSKLNRTTLYLASIVRDSQAFLHKSDTQRKTWFDLQECIQEALLLSEYEIQHGKVQISTRLKPYLLYGSRIVLLQILLNILKNSLQSLDQQQKREIVIEMVPSPHELSVRISDTGCGLTQTPQVLQSERVQGSGVGLSYCQHHMQVDFSGTLRLENLPSGNGCQCTLSFPGLDLEKTISQSLQSPVE